METLRNDIKHAWRLFRENKLFTATAIAALTLGIGVNIAIFSVVNAVLLKPMPFPDPDTLVQVVNANNGVAGGPASSPAKNMHWRAHTDVLEHVTAARNQDLNLAQGDLLESIRAGQTTWEYFNVLRPPLVMGGSEPGISQRRSRGRLTVRHRRRVDGRQRDTGRFP